MLYLILLALVFGLMLGAFIQRVLLSPPSVGKIKVAYDGAESPYFFLAVSRDSLHQILQEKYILLEVEHVNEETQK